MSSEPDTEEVTDHGTRAAHPRPPETLADLDRRDLFGMIGAAVAGLGVSLGISTFLHPADVPVEGPRPIVAAAHAPAEPGAASHEPSPAAPSARPSRPHSAASPEPAPSGRAPEGSGPGSLTIRSTPAGVVYVDGEPLGTTPVERHRLPAGEHRVEVRLGGHETGARTVNVRPGGAEALDFQLQKSSAAAGLLTIRSNPPSVVYVDGEPAGTTPLTDLSVAAGRRVIEFKLGGHATEQREVTVVAGKAAEIEVQMTRQ